MAAPSRNAVSENVAWPSPMFFVTTKTAVGKGVLQSDRNAALLVDVLRSCVADGHFLVYDFVVMPSHLHLLISVSGDMSVGKAMQFVKGRFSYRVKKELGFAGEVWQRGFSEVRADGQANLERYRRYIAQNPVRAGLVRDGEWFRWCFETLKRRKAQGLKPTTLKSAIGTTEVVP
ncbi:MAG: transposase [Acidobacteriaceae bacterium]